MTGTLSKKFNIYLGDDGRALIDKAREFRVNLSKEFLVFLKQLIYEKTSEVKNMPKDVLGWLRFLHEKDSLFLNTFKQWISHLVEQRNYDSLLNAINEYLNIFGSNSKMFPKINALEVRNVLVELIENSKVVIPEELNWDKLDHYIDGIKCHVCDKPRYMNYQVGTDYFCDDCFKLVCKENESKRAQARTEKIQNCLEEFKKRLMCVQNL